MADWLEQTFENLSNGSLRSAIAAGRMTAVERVHGETFVASRVGSAGEVQFRFVRAFVGTYDSVFGTPQVGAYVSIRATLHGCGDHARTRIVQVCREIVRARDGAVASTRPREQFRAERSGYSDHSPRSCGWRVDQSMGHDSVFWTDAGRKDGRDGGSTAPACLLDAPASLPDAATGLPARGVGKEFRTCIVSGGAVLASVAWGYYIDADGVVAMYPAHPVASAGAGDEVFDAIDRWDCTPAHRRSGIARHVAL